MLPKDTLNPKSTLTLGTLRWCSPQPGDCLTSTTLETQTTAASLGKSIMITRDNRRKREGLLMRPMMRLMTWVKAKKERKKKRPQPTFRMPDKCDAWALCYLTLYKTQFL